MKSMTWPTLSNATEAAICLWKYCLYGILQSFLDSVPQGVALFQGAALQANLYFNGFTLNTFSAIGLLSSNTIPSTRTSLFSSRSGESIASSS